jgi:hypothetical protein
MIEELLLKSDPASVKNIHVVGFIGAAPEQFKSNQTFCNLLLQRIAFPVNTFV